MSLTKQQNPYSSEQFVHQTTYPTYYTATSTQYTVADMKYKFKLYNSDGLVSTTKNPPYISNGVGVYNPNSYLKNLFTNDFQPTINNFATCDGSIIQYGVKLDEFYSGAVDDTETYYNVIAINASQEDFDANWTNYIMGGTAGKSGLGKFLNKFESRRKVSLLDEYGTVRFLSGNFNPLDSDYNSRVYQMYMEVQHTTGADTGFTYHYTSNLLNPYWYETTFDNDLSPTLIYPVTKHMLEFPCTPQIINQQKWTLIGLTLVNGSYIPFNTPAPFNFLIEGDEYSIQTYEYPKGIGGKTSYKQYFKIETPCANEETIQLQWKNTLGGYDFFRFEKVSSKTQNIAPSTYRKVRDTLSADYSMGHTDYDRGETVYHSGVETVWTLNTDWLSKQQVLDLEDLWYSKDVYAYIDSEWYPVISLANQVLINTTAKGLRQYGFSIKLSNKKYV